MGQSQMLGQDIMENIIFTEIGLDKPDPLMQHLQEEVIAEGFIFSKEKHDQIWNLLRKGNLYVGISDLLPFYMIFFFTYLVA